MQLLTLINKEIRQEIRSKESIISMTVFGVTVILLFAFAFNAAPVEFQKFLPGLIWMTYLFVSILGLLRSFASEKEMDAFAALLSSPIERGNIFLAKLISFWVFIIGTQILTMPLFAAFLNMKLGVNLALLAGVFLLTDWSIAAIGVMVSGMGLRTRMGEVLVPVLLFPLLSPALIGATKITTGIFNGEGFSDFKFWVMIILTFAVIFTLVGYLTFGSISEE